MTAAAVPSGGPAPMGRLLLMPNSLDLGTGSEVDLRQLLPQEVLQQAAQLGHWVVEDAKSARAFLKRVDRLAPLAQPLQALDIRELPRERKGAVPTGIKERFANRAAAPSNGGGGLDANALGALLAPARAGHDIGLLSEAGMPGVADPGADLVACAHGLGMAVVPLVGPSALLLALAASGLNGQSFAFVGYVPQQADARAARLKELEAASRRWRQTQIAIETPYRNAALLQALLTHLQPATRLCIACGLSLPQGFCLTRSVAQWRTQAPLLPEKLPAVFLWLAP